MGSTELSDQELRMVITSLRVTIVEQVSYLRVIPVLLENPTVAPEVAKAAMRELPQDIEKLVETLADIQLVEQWADERGLECRNWVNRNFVNESVSEVMQSVNGYISNRPN